MVSSQINIIRPIFYKNIRNHTQEVNAGPASNSNGCICLTPNRTELEEDGLVPLEKKGSGGVVLLLAVLAGSADGGELVSLAVDNAGDKSSSFGAAAGVAGTTD